MIVYLATGTGYRPWDTLNFYDFKALSSFFYIKDSNTIDPHKFSSFLLDSGAFSYMNSQSGHEINWDNYIEEYADYINRNDIELFMELDIDSLVGLKEVERLRNKLERLTGKKSIPVWHKSRGKDYWIETVKNYDYVAIGGIVTREIPPREHKYFTWFLNEARKYNCKVHGLGYTSLKGLKKYPFYSVDSTSWASGSRFGAVYQFKGNTLITHKKRKGMRVKNKETNINNFIEWVKFQKYAEHNL